jgi:hypothetical protein
MLLYTIKSHFGDPVTALYADEQVVAVGTAMGRITILYLDSLNEVEVSSKSKELIRDVFQLPD